ncbi:39S ribosomal protein L19, mitochondrial-like protein [Euroglyphus maynei]|uniref:Large ribosomal subunit protein bL19m n=1 Tax=Euroglyphus maynei TaxID=6958 RepID=A0A1Y3B4Y4_EURMA|nr:39S ribosomal protein L19, mitochondrial-like protein [Euroglyphus maynei]
MASNQIFGHPFRMICSKHPLLSSPKSPSLIACRWIRKNAFRPWVKTSLPETVKSDDPIVISARKSFGKTIIPEELADLRFAYPEFLPISEAKFRNPVFEKIVREDMIKRRTMIDIPEFYVGSIMAVTITDHWASGKLSRFVGICIERNGQGTFANFTLRNRVDGQGVEIRYDIYNPVIQEIQVLKLEKRLDDHLLYLRDALPKYSEIPFDMAPEPPRKPGEPVPLNTIKVEMKPWPWTRKWEYCDLNGIDKLPNMPDYNYINRWKHLNEYERFDLMAEYRSHIPEEQQLSIWKQVQQHQIGVRKSREIERRRKLIK